MNASWTHHNGADCAARGVIRPDIEVSLWTLLTSQASRDLWDFGWAQLLKQGSKLPWGGCPEGSTAH
jgi:hypothetical protein